MTDVPITDVPVGGQWVHLADFLDKPLVYTAPAEVRAFPSLASPIVATIPANQPIGVVFSYILNDDGLWWAVDRGRMLNGVPLSDYVLHASAQVMAPPAPPAEPGILESLFGPATAASSLTQGISGALQSATTLVLVGVGALVLLMVATRR